jgi:hypothetical protein
MRAKDTSKLVKEKIVIIKLMFMAGCKVAEIEEKTGLVNLLDFTRRHNKYFKDVKFIKSKEVKQNGATSGENENRV